MIERIKYHFEQNAFGVCTYLGEKFGISTSRIRLYFIYLSFITMASPVLVYLVLAFWINIKRYMRMARTAIDF
jgi:phage shock protein C